MTRASDPLRRRSGTWEPFANGASGGEPVSAKPSYLGLLNTLSLAESAAHEYLNAWIAVTEHDGVRATLQTVTAREGEHGLAFAKRINELGYTVKPKDDPGQAKRMDIAASRTMSDLEKMDA